MKNKTLKQLIEKIDEIKESWQIYEIFETERKNFNEEYQKLQEDKKSLMASFNDISAKNALLIAQNRELEAKNQALDSLIKQKENAVGDFTPPQENPQDLSKNPKWDNANFEAIQRQFYALENLFNSIKIPNLEHCEPLQKIEILYQKNQKLLATPAKNYFPYEIIQNFMKELKLLRDLLNQISLESSKLFIEFRDFKNTLLLPQESLKNLESLDTLNPDELQSLQEIKPLQSPKNNQEQPNKASSKVVSNPQAQNPKKPVLQNQKVQNPKIQIPKQNNSKPSPTPQTKPTQNPKSPNPQNSPKTQNPQKTTPN